MISIAKNMASGRFYVFFIEIKYLLAALKRLLLKKSMNDRQKIMFFIHS